MGIDKNRKYFFNQHFFDTIDSEDKSYWLGFVIADGSVRLSRLRGDLRIAVHRKDANHLEKFKYIIQYDGKLYKHPTDNCSTISLYSRILSGSLIKIGVIPNKTGKEFLPVIDSLLINHLIRGVFDGDGTIGCYNNSWALSFCSCSNKLLLEIKSIINNALGINKGSINNLKNRNAYRLKFEGNRLAPLVGDFLYKNSNIYLDRKYEKYKEMVGMNYGIK